MCGCSSNCDSLNTGTLPTGLPGPTGATGAQGIYGGFSADWIFSTSTSTGPSSSQLRFNNATYSSVTEIYVSDDDVDGTDYDPFLDSLSNNGNYGMIRIFKETDHLKFWLGIITGVTDNGTDHTLTVTYIDSNSTFSASDAIVLTFSPSGASGSSVLSNNTTDVATSGSGTDALMSYIVPINKLKTNEDVLEIEASYVMSGLTQDKNISFSINGSNFVSKLASAPVANTFSVSKGVKYTKAKISITRKSATAVYIDILISNYDDVYMTLRGFGFNEGTGAGYAVSDLSANTLTFACFGSNYDAVSNTETITQNQLLVKYLNK